MEIIVDSTEPKHYESGQTVSGVLRVNITDPWSPSDINLGIVGYAKVEWAPGEVFGMFPSVPVTPSLTFSEKKTSLELFYKINEDEMKTSGNFKEFPFKFELPPGIPSSYESDDAEVVYKIVAVLKTADGKQHRFERKLKILSPIFRHLMIPVTSGAEKQFGTLSLGSGYIILHASMVRKGFHPGDKVIVNVDVQNYSSVDCTPRATLYMTKILLFGERHKSSQTALSEAVVGKKVDKQSNENQSLSIDVPEDAALTIKCEQISLKYFIHVTLDIPHAFDIHVNLPFVVTTRSVLYVQD